MPVARRLFSKGLPLGAGIAFLLGGPIVNPLVDLSTAVAYGDDLTMALGRIPSGYLIAVAMGLFIDRRFRLFLTGGAVMLTTFIWVILFGRQRRETGWQLAVTMAKAIVLMAPLLFLYVVVGQGMGAHALQKKYTGMEQQTLARLLESGKANPTPDMSLLDLARRMKQMDGRRVITEGLVYRPDIMPENYLTLFRFAIFCCAADALPVWVFVEKAGVEAFDDEAWIRVDGTVQIVNFNGTDVPVIKADTIEEKAAPSPGEQYLFF